MCFEAGTVSVTTGSLSILYDTSNGPFRSPGPKLKIRMVTFSVAVNEHPETGEVKLPLGGAKAASCPNENLHNKTRHSSVSVFFIKKILNSNFF